DGIVHLWETNTGKEWRGFSLEEPERQEGPPHVDHLCLSSDGKRLAAVARFDRSGCQINVCDVATGKLLARRPLAPEPGQGFGFEVFTPDGQRITARVPEGVA